MAQENDKDRTTALVYTAIDHILEGNQTGLLRSILNDFTPTEGQKAPGLSFRSIFRAIGFAIRHPLHTMRLARFAASGGYKSPEFQTTLLNHDKLWNALDQAAPGNIAQIGKIAASFMQDVLTYGPAEAPVYGPEESPILSAAAIANLRSNPRLRTLLTTNAEALQSLVMGLQKKEPIKGLLELYKIDPVALNLTSWALRNVDDVLAIVDSFAIKEDTGKRIPFMNATEIILGVINKNPELAQFFKSNPHVVPGLSDGYLNSSPEWTEWTNAYGLNSGILKAMIPPLLSDPKMTQDVVAAYNKGDFLKLTEILIEDLNKPNGALLKALQTTDGKQALTQLIIDVVQYNPALQTILKNYGVDPKAVAKLAKIAEILLDKPEDLQKVFDHVQKDNLGMFVAILEVSKDNARLQTFLEENKELFGKVAQKLVETKLQVTPESKTWITSGTLKATDQVAKLVVGYIQKPQHIIDLITGYQEGSATKVTKALAGMGWNNTVAGTGHVARGVANVAKDIAGGVVSGTQAVLNDPTVQAVSKALDPMRITAATTGSIVGGMIGGTLGPIGAAAGSTIGGAVLGATSDGAKQAVIATAQATAYVASAAASITNQAFWAGVSYLPWSKTEAQKQADALNKDHPIDKGQFSNVTIKGTEKNKRLLNVDITDSTFEKATISNASFKSSTLTRVVFHGAKLNNVSFSGSKIDAETLSSILSPSTIRHNVSFAGVEIPAEVLREATERATADNPIDLTRAIVIGDISDVDMTHVVGGGKIRYKSAEPITRPSSPNSSFSEQPPTHNHSFISAETPAISANTDSSTQQEAKKIAQTVIQHVARNNDGGGDIPPAIKSPQRGNLATKRTP